MIEEIKFKENPDKKVDISIDNEHQQIPIYEIDKFQTFINLNKPINTPLRENIVVDAYIYRLPYDTILNERQIKKENIIQIDGIVTITIYNANNNIYYQKDIKFKYGHIYDDIINRLPIGTYPMTIEYKGNKYFKSSTLSINLNIEKRPVDVVFEYNTYNGNPSSTIQVSAKLIDSINNKPVSQCPIHYDFDKETYANISDINGNVTFNIKVPEIEESYCSLYNAETGFPNISYLLTVYSDSESYTIYNAQTTIIANKLSTSIAVNSSGAVENNISTISGPVIDANNDSVKYGNVIVKVLDTEYSTSGVVEDGIFEASINFTEVYDFNSKIETMEIYDELVANRPTKIQLNTEESTVNNIIVGEPIIVSIKVVNESDENDYITDGMVLFTLYSQNDSKELYRYATEIDSVGESIFVFNTSREGKYKISVSYYGMFGYNDCINKIYIGDQQKTYIENITVTEN